jgi:drug/metabolite transporter (DMT)-like permease
MRRAYLYTLIAVFAWTTGPVGSKAALLSAGPGPALTPTQVAFWSVAIGWVLIVGLLAVRGRLALVGAFPARGWAVLALMGAFGWMAYQVALNFAYTRLPLADALIISYLNPVWVVLLQAPAFGQVLRPLSGFEQQPDTQEQKRAAQVASGLAVCILGVAVTATGGRLAALRHMQFEVGALAALFAGFAWGVYSNLGRFVPVRRGLSERGLSDVQTLIAMSFGLLLMGGQLAASGRLGWPARYATPLHLGGAQTAVGVWAIILTMAVFNYALGYPMWLRSLELGAHAGGASKLPPLTYLVLVTSATLGWLLLRQPLGNGFWIGAVLILGGNAVTLWPRRSVAVA